MEDNGPDTLKIKNIDAMNELEYVQIMYERALSTFISRPSWENRWAFLEANKRLVETTWAYRKGAELLTSYKLSHSGFSRLGGGL